MVNQPKNTADTQKMRSPNMILLSVLRTFLTFCGLESASREADWRLRQYCTRLPAMAVLIAIVAHLSMFYRLASTGDLRHVY